MSSRKRKYFPNQEIKVKGFSLSITANRTVYYDSDHGCRKLDSLWQPKVRILSVVLPNDELVKLDATGPLKLIEDKKLENEAEEANS